MRATNIAAPFEGNTIGRRAWWQETAVLATCGLIGPILFMAVALVLPRFSEYTLAADFISELAIGRHGWVQTVTFFVAGLSSLALALGLRQALGRGRGSRVGSGLLLVWGICLVVDGFFPIDPVGTGQASTLAGTIHLGVALLAFLCAMVAMFVLSFAFKRAEGWRSFVPWSFLLAGVALITFFLPSEGGRAGIYQRIFVGTVMLWLALAAIRLRAVAMQGPVGGTRR